MDFCRLIPTSRTMWVVNKCHLIMCRLVYEKWDWPCFPVYLVILPYFITFKSSKLSGYFVYRVNFRLEYISYEQWLSIMKDFK